MASPLVSVVVATYNYAHYIPGAIDSALGQTFANLEVLVIDDGSTDATPEVMRAYAGDPRVRYIRTENRGQPAAENRGIVESRGAFVAFLDADDRWLPAKTQKQLDLFGGRPEVGVAYTLRQMIDAEGYPLETTQPELHRGDVLAPMFANNFVCFSSSMVRREVFDRVGMFNEARRNASDYDLWLRAALVYPFDYVAEPLVLYRVGHRSLRGGGDVQLDTALAIMREFTSRDDLPASLSQSHVRRCFAAVYAHRGLVERDRSVVKAMNFYLKALACEPLSLGPWRGMVAAVLPEPARRIARRLAGRPAEWPAHRRLETARGAAGDAGSTDGLLGAGGSR